MICAANGHKIFTNVMAKCAGHIPVVLSCIKNIVLKNVLRTLFTCFFSAEHFALQPSCLIEVLPFAGLFCSFFHFPPLEFFHHGLISSNCCWTTGRCAQCKCLGLYTFIFKWFMLYKLFYNFGLANYLYIISCASCVRPESGAAQNQELRSVWWDVRSVWWDVRAKCFIEPKHDNTLLLPSNI